jgi:3-phosphoshikimate 1-carboxyvinyltransferase
VDLTCSVMRAFGAEVTWVDDDTLRVAPGGYRGCSYRIEPDASAASYFFAAAAIAGGRVQVRDLHRDAHQGDVAFVDVLAAMGATVEDDPGGLAVTVAEPLHGVDTDFTDISDTAQTLAAVAVFAEGATTVEGIGFIRRKETDRIAAVVTELRRCGIDADELSDGFRVHPGQPRSATIETYDDHRMAMSLRAAGPEGRRHQDRRSWGRGEDLPRLLGRVDARRVRRDPRRGR